MNNFIRINKAKYHKKGNISVMDMKYIKELNQDALQTPLKKTLVFYKMICLQPKLKNLNKLSLKKYNFCMNYRQSKSPRFDFMKLEKYPISSGFPVSNTSKLLYHILVDVRDKIHEMMSKLVNTNARGHKQPTHNFQEHLQR